MKGYISIMEYGIIKKINGPVIHAENVRELSMHEMVYVGNEELIGEVIAIEADCAVIQVYESTEGISAGEKVKGTGGPLCITLAPGRHGKSVRLFYNARFAR